MPMIGLVFGSLSFGKNIRLRGAVSHMMLEASLYATRWHFFKHLHDTTSHKAVIFSTVLIKRDRCNEV